MAKFTVLLHALARSVAQTRKAKSVLVWTSPRTAHGALRTEGRMGGTASCFPEPA